MSTIYVYRADQSVAARFVDGLRDMIEGALMWRTWATLGWRDMRHQTERTVLGPLWSILGTGIQVGALGFVFGALLAVDPAQGFPYIAAGLSLWFFISCCVVGGLSVFVNAAGVLKERSLPVSFSVYRYTVRITAELMYKFVLFVIVAALVGLSPSWNNLWVVPGLAIFILNGLWVLFLFGVTGARFRDLSELFGPLMLIAFLTTPVLWQEHFLGDNRFVAAFNPFTHFLAIVREPMLGNPMPMTSLMAVAMVTVVGWIAAIVTYSLSKNRIVFWL